NRYAQVVIDMMGVLNPHLRDVSDFKHKLWDHLQIISDFKIDVDSPYPIPSRDAIHKKPDLLEYPQHRIRYKHYGHTVERMIEKWAELSNGKLVLPADTVLTKLDFKTPPPGSRTKGGGTATNNNNNQKNNQKSGAKKVMVKKKIGPKKGSFRK